MSTSRFLCVLDASAVLALLHAAPGADVVEPALDGSAISAVNWCEIVQKAMSRGVPVEGLRADLEALGLSLPV